MAKKKAGAKNDATFKFRCRQADLDAFREAAEHEGFGGNITAWMLFHLRRQAKDTNSENQAK